MTVKKKVRWKDERIDMIKLYKQIDNIYYNTVYVYRPMKFIKMFVNKYIKQIE